MAKPKNSKKQQAEPALAPESEKSRDETPAFFQRTTVEENTKEVKEPLAVRVTITALIHEPRKLESIAFKELMKVIGEIHTYNTEGSALKEVEVLEPGTKAWKAHLKRWVKEPAYALSEALQSYLIPGVEYFSATAVSEEDDPEFKEEMRKERLQFESED